MELAERRGGVRLSRERRADGCGHARAGLSGVPGGRYSSSFAGQSARAAMLAQVALDLVTYIVITALIAARLAPDWARRRVFIAGAVARGALSVHWGTTRPWC